MSVALSLERHGDASAVVEFMRHQTKPILPGLAKVIARLMAGEPFPRDDGYLLRLEPPGFDKAHQRQPSVQAAGQLRRRTGMLVHALIENIAQGRSRQAGRRDCGGMDRDAGKPPWQRYRRRGPRRLSSSC